MAAKNTKKSDTKKGTKKSEPTNNLFVPQVDPNYINHPWAHVVTEALEQDDAIMLLGECGTGKSSQIEQIAAALNQGYRRVNLNGQTTISDLIGQHLAKPEEGVYWVDGIVPQAMRAGHILNLDEIDFAEPHMLAVLHGVLESARGGRQLVLAENGGEVVIAHPDFRVVASANSIGADAEQRGRYGGTSVMNEAFLDRFECVLRIPYPHPTFGLEILQRQVPGLPESIAVFMIRVAEELRDAHTKEDVSVTMSPRKLIQWGRKIVRYGDIEAAARVTFLNKMSREDSEVFAEAIQRWIGGRRKSEALS